MKNKHLLQADKDPPCVLVNVFREKANGQSWPWCPFARRQCGRERKQVLHFAEDLCAARAATTLPDEIIQHLYPVWTQTISNPTSHVAALTRFQNAPVLEPTNKPDSRLHVSFQNVCLTDAWEHHVVERQFKPIFGSKTYQWEGTREKKWKKKLHWQLATAPFKKQSKKCTKQANATGSLWRPKSITAATLGLSTFLQSDIACKRPAVAHRQKRHSKWTQMSQSVTWALGFIPLKLKGK